LEKVGGEEGKAVWRVWRDVQEHGVCGVVTLLAYELIEGRAGPSLVLGGPFHMRALQLFGLFLRAANHWERPEAMNTKPQPTQNQIRKGEGR
jgi:hypothetical protein